MENKEIKKDFTPFIVGGVIFVIVMLFVFTSNYDNKINNTNKEILVKNDINPKNIATQTEITKTQPKIENQKTDNYTTNFCSIGVSYYSYIKGNHCICPSGYESKWNVDISYNSSIGSIINADYPNASYICVTKYSDKLSMPNCPLGTNFNSSTGQISCSHTEDISLEVMGDFICKERYGSHSFFNTGFDGGDCEYK